MYSLLPKKRRKWQMGGVSFNIQALLHRNTLNYRLVLFKLTSFTLLFSHFNLPFWKAFFSDFNRFHYCWNNSQERSEMTTSELEGRKATDSHGIVRARSYQQIEGRTRKQKGHFRNSQLHGHPPLWMCTTEPLTVGKVGLNCQRTKRCNLSSFF